MQRTLAELKADCSKRGIAIPTGKFGRKELVNLMAKQSFAAIPNPSWGLRMRLEIESPMLCFAWWHLHAEEKEVLTNSTDWLAEQKWDGARIILCYHPDEGFTCFSRNLSVEDYLPVDYTNKILFIHNGQVRRGSDYKNSFKTAFILDTELLATQNIDTSAFTARGGTTGTKLNAVSAILSIGPASSQAIQQAQCPLKFMAFDLLYFNTGWTTALPLIKRKHTLNPLCRILTKYAPIEESAWVSVYKNEFYDDLTANGAEGIVYKHKQMPYITKDSRPRTTQIKRKRSVGEDRGADIDAYVIGYVASDPKKGWADYIGALKMGIMLRLADGTEREHWIATISAIPLELRKEMSQTGADGKPELRPEYYKRVMVINGQDASPKAKRFMHATTNWDIGFREDKSYLDCVMDEAFLDACIL